MMHENEETNNHLSVREFLEDFGVSKKNKSTTQQCGDGHMS